MPSVRIQGQSKKKKKRDRVGFFVGADIIMQLDDVVSSTISGPRVEEAMWRFGETSWLPLDVFIV